MFSKTHIFGFGGPQNGYLKRKHKINYLLYTLWESERKESVKNTNKKIEKVVWNNQIQHGDHYFTVNLLVSSNSFFTRCCSSLRRYVLGLHAKSYNITILQHVNKKLERSKVEGVEKDKRYNDKPFYLCPYLQIFYLSAVVLANFYRQNRQ